MAALACAPVADPAHLSFLFLHQLQLPSQYHFLGAGRERRPTVLPGIFFPRSPLAVSPLKAGKSPDTLAYLLLLHFPQFFIGMQNLSHTQMYGIEIFFFLKILLLRLGRNRSWRALSLQVRGHCFELDSQNLHLKYSRLSVTAVFL